ncbi:hypothetical protein [Paraburkholderia bonniea]|uniref:hypothetical protein n=1 Tax=Paraburkholderia bonniea TaxID=2152891 RepID=UPI00158101D8|nr:hypothetical protein [Paraburkholderia bonniea]
MGTPRPARDAAPVQHGWQQAGMGPSRLQVRARARLQVQVQVQVQVQADSAADAGTGTAANSEPDTGGSLYKGAEGWVASRIF